MSKSARAPTGSFKELNYFSIPAIEIVRYWIWLGPISNWLLVYLSSSEYFFVRSVICFCMFLACCYSFYMYPAVCCSLSIRSSLSFSSPSTLSRSSLVAFSNFWLYAYQSLYSFTCLSAVKSNEGNPSLIAVCFCLAYTSDCGVSFCIIFS